MIEKTVTKEANKSSLWNPLVKKTAVGGELQPGSFHQDGSAQLRLGEPRRIGWCWMLRGIIFPVQSRVHSISAILKDFSNFTKRLFEDIEPAICQIKSPESKRKGLQIFRDPQTQPFVLFWGNNGITTQRPDQGSAARTASPMGPVGEAAGEVVGKGWLISWGMFANEKW